ncbi:MAG: nuclear transport factor 2 family protein, partial [Lysobacter sp.]
RLRAAMDELQNAIEQHDAARIEERLSKDFVGPDGLDRAGARRIAAASFLRYRDVWMRIASVELKVQGDRATVNFIAAISGGSGQPLPEVAQMYRVQTGWREEDGEWRITSAQWVGRW